MNQDAIGSNPPPPPPPPPPLSPPPVPTVAVDPVDRAPPAADGAGIWSGVKKGAAIVVGCGVFFVACVTALGSSVEPDAVPAGSEPEQLAFGSDEDHTTTISTTTTVATTASTTTTAESTSTTEETTTTTEVEVDDAEVREIAFLLLVRSEFPVIDFTIESNPSAEEHLLDLAESTCAVGATAENADQMSLALLLVWSDMDPSSRLMFNDDPTSLAEFAGMAMAAKCPETAERLFP